MQTNPNLLTTEDQWGAPAKESKDRSGTLGIIIIGVLLSATMIVAVWLIIPSVGPQNAFWAAIIALVPLAIVLGTVFWIDRWEPEPRSLLLFAFLWGAGVSALGALFLNTGIMNLMLVNEMAPNEAEIRGTVLVAPITEEVLKSLGIMILALTRPKYFDSIIDAVVYSMMIAAGFAFTENILYFGNSLVMEEAMRGSVMATFFARAVMSPFAHALFTTFCGIVIGYFCTTRLRKHLWLAYAGGLLLAIALHSLWNGSATAGSIFNTFYFFVQVPIFLSFLALILWLRKQEQRILRTRLQDYAAAGWIADHEVQVFSQLAARRRALRWARELGPDAHAAMKRLVRSMIQLAHYREKVVRDREHIGQQFSETEILSDILKDRKVLLTASRRK